MAEKQKRKFVNFDLYTKKLKEIYTSQTGNKYTTAYKEIKKFMLENGFSHRQWSGYTSDDMMVPSKIISVIRKLSDNFPWFQFCVRRIDVSAIEQQFDLTEIFQTEKAEKPNMEKEHSSSNFVEKKDSVSIEEKYEKLLQKHNALIKKYDELRKTVEKSKSEISEMGIVQEKKPKPHKPKL